MKIEWASHFRSDGSRRKPPPSTMHGWLAKMRGTLLGNEELRSKGMKEMQDARYHKKVKSQRSQRRPAPPARRDTGSSALFGTLNPKPRPVGRGTPIRSSSGQHAMAPRRPSQQSTPRRDPSGPGTRRPSSVPTPQRRATPQRRHTGR
ncbi:hypothetical protein MIND_00751900 [Mycena indigotica]|uniref:Uncharacterized protein n=1 Tax=Mycena indigotica TaxID=2126181 RepID=A0A8H6SN18_9AGAR|nr:uncharacterized protein MIND_00751900 [Mycena indigotica]KAF7301860.1 hypothetical protein MIND_00751900 [Mycena indigotica]